MKILVTGAHGFIGKNLVAELRNRGYSEILEFGRECDLVHLDQYTKDCEFVFHLAGVNRPSDDQEFLRNNVDFTSDLLHLLKEHNNQSPILMTSSIQVLQDNPYGQSKMMGELLLRNYSEETGTKVIIYRLTNVFGKWCKPNYNSVVATFCHNIARRLEIKINNENSELNLCYIDDVVEEFINAMEGNVSIKEHFGEINTIYRTSVGELASLLYSFQKNRETLVMPSLKDEFDRALYATYLSYLEVSNFSYKLKKHEDNRGWLAEFIKSESMGQIFISKTKPGITRGNHWHHTKVEKFLVVQGIAKITFRKVGTSEVLEYKVNGDVPEVVDIPAGYIHAISNIGEEDVITLFWACEIFDADKPDTYFEEV